MAANPAGIISAANGATVYQQQVSYVASEPQSRLVEIADLPTYDGIHLIAASHCNLGERVYSAIYDIAASLYPVPNNPTTPQVYFYDTPSVVYSSSQPEWQLDPITNAYGWQRCL